jgi:hypothetical protein
MRMQGQQDAVTANIVFLQVYAIVRSTYTYKVYADVIAF